MFFRTILISLLLHLVVLWLLLRTPTPAVMNKVDVKSKPLKVVMITHAKLQPKVNAAPPSEVEVETVMSMVNSPELQQKSPSAHAGERQSAKKSLGAVVSELKAPDLPASQPKVLDVYTNLEQRIASAYAQSQAQIGQYQRLDQLPENLPSVPTSTVNSTKGMTVLEGNVVTGNYRFEQNGRCFVMQDSSPMSDSDMPAGEVPCVSNKRKKQAALKAAMDKWLK
ncbi:hypothetical protein [Pseudoalteromonas sp. GB56]